MWKKPGKILVYERLTLPIISDRDYTVLVRLGGPPAPDGQALLARPCSRRRCEHATRGNTKKN